jgi:cytochrome c-type biogenesis protein CcmH
MIDFWLPALLLGALAAAFVLAPLRGAARGGGDRALRRASNVAIFEDRLAEIRADLEAGEIDPDEARALEAELQRSLLRDADPDEQDAPLALADGHRLLLGAALAAPVLAVVLYADWGLSLGALADLELAASVEQLDAVERGSEGGGGEMRALAVRLADRLRSEPDDLDGWFLLGRTRLQLGEFEAASEAFEEMTRRSPDSVAPRVFQAQALYMADDRALTPRVRALVDAVLTLAPDQPIMLELLAMDAFQGRRFPEAADLFARVLASGIQDPARRQFLEDGLARSRELGGLPAATTAAAVPVPPAVTSGPSVSVEVELSDAALSELPSSAAVFVLARAVNGPRMPLAVRRLAPGSSLALTLTTDDAMSPAMTLATATEVELVARLSRSGTATPGPDDLEAVVGPLAPGESPSVQVRLDPAGSAGRIRPPESVADLAPAVAPTVASGPRDTAAASVRIPVLVEVSEGLEAAPEASVFVFAREVGGTPMPLAVARLTFAELPTLVTLDDGMAMMPGRTLSAATEVELVARVTAGGGVVAQAGDLEGVVGPLDPREVGRVVPLLVDRVVD